MQEEKNLVHILFCFVDWHIWPYFLLHKNKTRNVKIPAEFWTFSTRTNRICLFFSTQYFKSVCDEIVKKNNFWNQVNVPLIKIVADSQWGGAGCLKWLKQEKTHYFFVKEQERGKSCKMRDIKTEGERETGKETKNHKKEESQIFTLLSS